MREVFILEFYPLSRGSSMTRSGARIRIAMDSPQQDDTVELLFELVVETAEGNVYTYPAGTRLLYVRPGAQPGTGDLADEAGNLFPNVSAATFQKI
jgi:hypothetical protein